MIEMKDNHLELHPMVAMKRNDLPEELREKFLSRRGASGPAVPLSSFLDKIGYKGPQAKEPAEAAETLMTDVAERKAER